MGISRQDIVNTHKTQIVSRDHTLNSIGRNQHAATDQKFTVGAFTYWARFLYEFDTGNNVKTGSYYDVLEGTRSSDGGFFAVMFHCGNLVFKTWPPKPTPPPPTPIPTPKPTPTPKAPTVSCSYLLATPTTGDIPLKVDFSGAGAANGQTITNYLFDFGDGATKDSPSASVSHTYTKAGPITASLKIKGSTGKLSDAVQACALSIKPTLPPPSYARSKTAINVTQGNIDATSKPASGGDVITYQLLTQNTGGSAGSYTVVEHIEDILEYADVTDLDGAAQAGGVLTWPAATIKPGETLTTTFKVTVKKPVPDTPVGVSDPFSYDLVMNNVYGNAVNIKITPSFAKEVEAASTSLPDTGASTGTIIVIVIGALSLYFYLRNRQLETEIRLLRGQFQGGV
jgi:PKD repeat protein